MLAGWLPSFSFVKLTHLSPVLLFLLLSSFFFLLSSFFFLPQRCDLFRGLLNPRADPDISAFLTHEEAHQILVAMVDNLLPEVYLLGDSVIAQGEMGREMFFLVKGK